MFCEKTVFYRYKYGQTVRHLKKIGFNKRGKVANVHSGCQTWCKRIWNPCIMNHVTCLINSL